MKGAAIKTSCYCHLCFVFWCNLFIRIGERDKGMRQFVAATQSTESNRSYGGGINLFELLLRVVWALIKGPFGQL